MKRTSDIIEEYVMIAAPAKVNNKPEPTISDAMESIADLRGIVMDLTETVRAGFAESKQKFERIDGVLSTLQLGQDNLLVEVHDIKKRVTRLEYKFDDMQETLHDLSEAEAKDATASINHEGRIVCMEKIHNIQAVPPQHLAEIE